MNALKKTLTLLLLTLLPTIGTDLVAAEKSSANLRVNVNVLPFYEAQVSSAQESVTLTSEDIARGWVELPGAAEVFVRTNTGSTSMVIMRGQGIEKLGKLTVSNGFDEVEVGSRGAFLSTPSVIGNELFALDYRLELAPELQPGTYELPLSLDVLQAR